MKRTQILLLSGGQSAEHEVSLRSADFVKSNLDKHLYKLLSAVIGRDGVWRLESLSKHKKTSTERVLWPTPNKGCLFHPTGQPAEKIDIVFPLIHGTTGEDGCLPGLLEMARLPYVGCSVLGSAVGMDKIVQKSILRDNNIAVTGFLGFSHSEWRLDKKSILTRCQKMKGPWFVKPSGQGSSVGISHVSEKEKLSRAINEAFKFDGRVLVEKTVADVREFEVAVIMTKKPTITPAAEIISRTDFYDYKAKYESSDTLVNIPAKIGDTLEKKLKSIALKSTLALAIQGYCRVDFLFDKKRQKIYVNEINTVPGMTVTSAFPKLCEEAKIPPEGLLSQLIDLALASSAEKRKLRIDTRK